MKLKQYEKEAKKTQFYPETSKVIYPLLGLCGETGEVIEVIKKSLRKGNTIDKEALKLELGDLAWYVVAFVSDIETTKLSEINYPYAKSVTTQNIEELALDLHINVNNVVTYYKHTEGYKTDTPAFLLYDVLNSIRKIGRVYDISIEEIFEANILKLKRRDKPQEEDALIDNCIMSTANGPKTVRELQEPLKKKNNL